MIYLDYNATTPIAPEVVEAMLPYLREHHGNPSTTHRCGVTVRRAVDEAREKVAGLLGAKPDEIVFTSSGSEANNHVIKGITDRTGRTGGHIIISSVEHPAVDNPCRYLERFGVKVTRVPVDGTGMIDPDDVRKSLRPETMLISIMHANNEVGTIQPIAEVSRIAREANVPCHCDAAQTIGKIPVNVNELGVDFLSIAGHKFFAPQGVGALYVRSGREIEPLIHGAGHENGRRSGTEAVPNIVALGAAADLASPETDGPTTRALCAKLHDRLTEGLGDRVVLNGHPSKRLPNTLNISFAGLIGRELLARLDNIAASPGAACHSGSHKPSAVLTAMGVSNEMAVGAVRFSLGRPTTAQEIDQAASEIIREAATTT